MYDSHEFYFPAQDFTIVTDFMPSILFVLRSISARNKRYRHSCSHPLSNLEVATHENDKVLKATKPMRINLYQFSLSAKIYVHLQPSCVCVCSVVVRVGNNKKKRRKSFLRVECSSWEPPVDMLVCCASPFYISHVKMKALQL